MQECEETPADDKTVRETLERFSKNSGFASNANRPRLRQHDIIHCLVGLFPDGEHKDQWMRYEQVVGIFQAVLTNDPEVKMIKQPSGADCEISEADIFGVTLPGIEAFSKAKGFNNSGNRLTEHDIRQTYRIAKEFDRCISECFGKSFAELDLELEVLDQPQALFQQMLAEAQLFVEQLEPRGRGRNQTEEILTR